MASFTQKQSEYLAFIYWYTRVNRRPPAEADIQGYFRVSAPTVHNMVVKLHNEGLIDRTPGKSRSMEVLVPPDEFPFEW